MIRSPAFWLSLLGAAVVLALAADYLRPGESFVNPILSGRGKREAASRLRRAEEQSARVKGVYMTSAVANDSGLPATRLRENIVRILDDTELNGVVIDVKETDGGAVLSENLRAFLKTLHEKGVWTIARIAVFKDSSQEKNHPDWYLRWSASAGAKKGAIWRDRRGGSWLDPSLEAVWRYEADVAKAASDLGFDEAQFDYVRFPSDGDVRHIAYPSYRAKTEKHEVLKNFFAFLHGDLKAHRPELILSADLFGYVAVQQNDLGIGQRLADIGANFDYVSLMVYPSHYYAGFEVAADPKRNLAALFYPYQGAITAVVSNHPYDVVFRSLVAAADNLDRSLASSTPPAGPAARVGEAVASAPALQRRARLRPWLQDFDLGADARRGIRYDASKVRAQIDAAEAAGSSGWLLWNPGNVYSKEALKPESGR